MRTAVMTLIALVALAGCGPRGYVVSSQASPARTAGAERLPSPPPAPSPFGSPVAAVVLPPATVLPVASLCSFAVYATADGNYEPRFCSDGSINVVAWRLYTRIGPHILAAGKDATVGQIVAAIDADFSLHATNIEVLDSYQLAAAYYGWTFSPNPACEHIYQMAVCY